jgi:hypothetical protein
VIVYYSGDQQPDIGPWSAENLLSRTSIMLTFVSYHNKAERELANQTANGATK